MAEQQNEAPVEKLNISSIGSQLKEARQAKKLSESEVAAELRVSASVITFIENEQWESLPARTYARGYYANYVRFIGLPHDEMMAQFDLSYSVASPSPELKTIGAPVKTKSFPWATMIVVVSLIIILWFAYQEWQQAQSVQPSVDVQTSESDLLESPIITTPEQSMNAGDDL